MVKLSTNIFVALIALVAFLSRNALAELPGHWQSRAPMPSARTEVAAVELGGKIYVIGGYEKGGNLIEEYDPGTDRWRGRAPLPKPLH
ncbi:MAG TPA: kelch repeat-containing protein, partial [Candidatus Binatia bacterium]|nr:kelch repeat-containing protein [Candidatus Binatia bacterium]